MDASVMWKLSDESLLAGLGSGDRDAAAAFVERFQRRVFGLTRSILRDRGAAEEAAQEAFVRAWRHASAYDPRRGTVAAWLLTIARNVSINMLPARRFDPIDREVLLAMEARRPHDEGDSLQEVDSAPLREALRRLPEGQRRALVMAVFYGYTAKEMSELDGVPLGTAKTRIRSAMMKLRSELGCPMTSEMGCEQARELAPEVALGIATGEERGAALRHLAGCPACRQLVSELSSVGDDLLLLAPAQDPPPGFQCRVLDAITEPVRPRRLHALTPGALLRGGGTRGRRWAAAAAAAVLVAALSGGSVFAVTANDRRLADSYRAVLSAGQGSAFAAAPLQGPRGRAGTVFGYQGQPSWMVVSVRPSIPDTGPLRVEAVTRDGRYLTLGKAVLGGGNRAWGGQIPVNLPDVQALRFLRSNGQTAFSAAFNGVKSWGD